MKEFYYPVYLDLRGRDCLVVGGGEVARGKVMGLLPCGARVRVISPDADPVIQSLARNGKVRWEQRTYGEGDATGAFLVIAATDDTQMNEAVYQEAVRERALCNVVDVPERCQFVAASIFRRGPLVAAISTGGASPALASRLRRDLMRHWGPEYGQVTLAFGRLRPYVRAHIRDIEDRKQFWKDIVQRSEPFEMARSGASRQALDTFLQGEVARWVAAQDTQRVSG